MDWQCLGEGTELREAKTCGSWAALLLVPILAMTLSAPAGAGEAQPRPAAPTTEAATPAVSAASAAVHQHSQADHVEKIRRAHINRLMERLETSAEELRQRCRFESQIATLPPQSVVSLTFDDGPEPGHTELILAALTEARVPATFFLIAEKAARHPDLVAKMRALPGAVIGNHSWSHPNFHDIPVPEQLQEVERANTALRDDLSKDRLFRYPYGNSSCEANDSVRGLGYQIVGWHVDSCDWAFDGPEGLSAREALSCGVAAAYRKDFVGHVLSGVRAHRGGIVLMHETHRNSVDHLGEIIQRLKEEGFSFGSPIDAGFAASLR